MIHVFVLLTWKYFWNLNWHHIQ